MNPANKRAVHSVVQLFIHFRGFVHSVSRSLVFAGERSVARLIFHVVIRLSVRSLGCSFARVSAFSFVCASDLFSCSYTGLTHKQDKSRKSSQVQEKATLLDS